MSEAFVVRVKSTQGKCDAVDCGQMASLNFVTLNADIWFCFAHAEALALSLLKNIPGTPQPSSKYLASPPCAACGNCKAGNFQGLWICCECGNNAWGSSKTPPGPEIN